MRIAIDDFGAGYSSLGYLQRFPVDALKIDRSFIARLTKDADGEKLIRTLVQLGKSLSIETLAEGIEQSSELSLLKEEQCEAARASCSLARSTFPRPSCSCTRGSGAPARRCTMRGPAARIAVRDGASSAGDGRGQQLALGVDAPASRDR